MASYDVVNNVPWIVGFNSGEGGMSTARYFHNNASLAKELNKYYKRFFPIAFFYRFWIEDETKIAEVTEKLKKYYFGDKDIGVETAHELVQLYTDGLFAFDALEAAQRHKGTVYFYHYDHKNQQTFSNVVGSFDGDLGVCHGDELISLFDFGLFSHVTEGNDLEVSKRLVKYWVIFAYNGNPNSEHENWTPVVSNDVEYLLITTKADEMKKNVLRTYQFWKDLQIAPSFKAGNSPQLTDEL